MSRDSSAAGESRDGSLFAGSQPVLLICYSSLFFFIIFSRNRKFYFVYKQTNVNGDLKNIFIIFYKRKGGVKS